MVKVKLAELPERMVWVVVPVGVRVKSGGGGRRCVMLMSCGVEVLEVKLVLPV